MEPLFVAVAVMIGATLIVNLVTSHRLSAHIRDDIEDKSFRWDRAKQYSRNTYKPSGHRLLRANIITALMTVGLILLLTYLVAEFGPPKS